MTNTLLSKFDDEMSKPHTDTEDRIHNWLVDNQVDDSVAYTWFKEYFTTENLVMGPIDGLSHAQVSHAQVNTTSKPKPKKKKSTVDDNQLDLFSDF